MKLTIHALLPVLCCLLLSSRVAAHGYMASVRINNRTYIGNPFQNLAQTNANGSAVRLAPPNKGYTGELFDPGMACGSNGTTSGPVAHYPAVSGDVLTMTMTLVNNTLPWPHVPCVLSAWMALCPASPSGCTNVDASTLQFFKIRQDGVTPDGYWPMQILMHNTDFRTDGIGAGPEYYAVIPQDLAPGNWLLRYEVDCLFQTYASGSRDPALAPSYPEIYPWCVQLNLSSTGKAVPTGVLMDEAYTSSEFSNVQNATASIEVWPMPGPPVPSLDTDAATRSFDSDPSTGYYNYNGSNWVHATGDTYAYQGTMSCSNDSAATYAFAFVGTGFSLLFGSAPNRGQFDVTIDGVSLGTVGSANTVGGESQYSVQYQNDTLALGVHTVVVSQGGQNVYLCNDLVQLQGGMLPASRLPVLLTPVPPLAAASNGNSTESPPAATENSSDNKPNIGAIAGGVVGGVVVLGAIIIGAFLCVRSRRRSARKEAEARRTTLDGSPEEPKTDPEAEAVPYFLPAMSSAYPTMSSRSAASQPMSPVDEVGRQASRDPGVDPSSVGSGSRTGELRRTNSMEKRGLETGSAPPRADPASAEMSPVLSSESGQVHLSPTPTVSSQTGPRRLPRPPSPTSPASPTSPTHAVDAGRFEELPPLYEHAVAGVRSDAGGH